MPRLKTETFGTGDPSWLDSTHGIYDCRSVNLDISAFTENTHYPDGYLLSGTPLAKITASGKYGPYGGNANEVQIVTPASAGNNTTVTFDGESTGAVDIDLDAGGADDLKAALEGLSNINPGDVEVELNDPATDFTVTFMGQYAGKNVPLLGVTGTGSSATTVDTSGGSGVSDGRETFVGFLRTDQPTDGVEDINVPIFEHGRVREDNLPIAIDAAAKSAVPQITYV